MKRNEPSSVIEDKTTSDDKLTVSIDTMYLVGKLTDEQIEELFDRLIFYENNLYQDKYFRYSRKIGNIIIKVFPRNLITYINYNVMVILQNNASSTEIPYSIKEILQFDSWKIKRIDIAFDFSNDSPFSTFANRFILKHHGNVKFLQTNKNDNAWKSEYLGTLHSKIEAKACIYDRNEKEVDRCTAMEHDFPLRFEVRLFPKLNEYNFLKRIDHGWIENKLSKFIFIADIEQLPLNKWDKRRLYKIQEDYDYLKTLNPAKKKELKKVVKENRVQFEEIYISKKQSLFSFLAMENPNFEIPVGLFEQLNFNEELFSFEVS